MIFMRKTFMRIVVFSLVVFLVACGSKTEEKESLEFTDEEIVKDDQIVATINGTEITGEEYNSIYVQTKVRLHQYRQDVSDLDFLKERTLNTLIDQELLRQDARRIGISVSEEEVQNRFTEAKEEVSEEQFSSFLEQNQLTETEFKDQLYLAILHEKYLQSEMPKIEITEEEIKELYEEKKDENKNFPDYEDIAEMLKQEIMMQKEQAAFQGKIEQLRKNAEIEIMI